MYHHNYYKLIAIDLSIQTNTRISQQINFTETLKEDNGATMFSIAENYPKLSFRFINCNGIIKTTEHKKISSLINESSDSKFVTIKWNIVNDQSNVTYGVGNEIIYNTEVLKSNLYD